MATSHFYINPPFSGLSPLSSKKFCTPPPSKWLNFWKVLPPSCPNYVHKFIGIYKKRPYFKIFCIFTISWSSRFAPTNLYTIKKFYPIKHCNELGVSLVKKIDEVNSKKISENKNVKEKWHLKLLSAIF